MKKFYLLYIVCFSLGLTSCFSSVCVRVHSFDMAKMRTSPEYRNIRNQEELKNYDVLLTGGYFDQLDLNIYQQVKDSLVADTLYFDRKYIPATMVGVRIKIDSVIRVFKQKTVIVRNALDDYIGSPLETLKQKYDTAYGNFVTNIESFTLFLKELAWEIKQNPNDPGLFGFSLAKEFEQFNKAHNVNFTFGSSIADDVMASFVAKAPEEYWQKYKSSFYNTGTDLSKSKDKAIANETMIRTFIGNSDIAVKMDGPANFVIKGVRLDADAAFRTSFKVLSQGIKYLTYAAGMPATPASGSSNTPAAVIPEIQNLHRNKQQSQALNDSYQLLTDAFLKVLDAQKADLQGSDDTKRQNAINTIKAAYSFYKSQLPTQNP